MIIECSVGQKTDGYKLFFPCKYRSMAYCQYRAERELAVVRRKSPVHLVKCLSKHYPTFCNTWKHLAHFKKRVLICDFSFDCFLDADTCGYPMKVLLDRIDNLEDDYDFMTHFNDNKYASAEKLQDIILHLALDRALSPPVKQMDCNSIKRTGINDILFTKLHWADFRRAK